MAESLAITSTLTENKPSANSIPIVFIHGWGLNSSVWQPLLAKLNEHLTNPFELITIDLPGFGNSNHVTIEPYNLESIAELVVTTINKPAIYLGWSLGGHIASSIALTMPEKVLGLISVASSPCFVEQNSDETWPGIKANILTGFHKQLSVDTEKTITGFLKIQAMGSPHIRQDLKKITQLVMSQPLPNKATLDESLKLLETTDLRNQLAELSVPFLRLYGKNDSLVPKSIAEKVAKFAPDSEYHIFPQASHAPFISHADEFKEVLSNWLTANFDNKN